MPQRDWESCAPLLISVVHACGYLTLLSIASPSFTRPWGTDLESF